jgi:2-dehydro-3-deoxygalactonokinase
MRIVSEHGLTPAFIGVDWGTSNARFMLIAHDGTVLAECAGAGIATLAGAGPIAAAFSAGTADWTRAHPDLPVLMCGMVGANIGWRTAPYVATPAGVEGLCPNLLRFEDDGRSIFIIPGVETVRGDGAPDMMRGEETQIFGAMGAGDGLACLPGTHCKWAVVSGGKITRFHTALSGELMALIGAHSILLNPRGAPHAQVSAAFDAGVCAAHSQALGLESMLFTVRSLQISGALAADQAGDYLSGLCIGADVKSALTLYPRRGLITLIGTPALTALYCAALQNFGCEAKRVNGDDAVVRGLMRIYADGLHG